MIKDNLNNAEKYYNLSEEIKFALEFLRNNDLKNYSDGKYQLKDDDIYMNVETYETKISNNIEAHRKYIDIQYMILGEENMGVSSLENLIPITNYDEIKDIIFYNGNIEKTLVKENEFIIFYPQDAHLPCQITHQKQKVKKAVVKIKVN